MFARLFSCCLLFVIVLLIFLDVMYIVLFVCVAVIICLFPVCGCYLFVVLDSGVAITYLISVVCGFGFVVACFLFGFTLSLFFIVGIFGGV